LKQKNKKSGTKKLLGNDDIKMKVAFKGLTEVNGTSEIHKYICG
jgi:hypothetical protein